MTDAQTWMLEHKGALVRRVGMIWECGDDTCGCEQARVIAYYQNKVVPRARVPVCEWEGNFFTDHESGADDELAAHRRELAKTDPAREAAIEWQRGVDYSA